MDSLYQLPPGRNQHGFFPKIMGVMPRVLLVYMCGRRRLSPSPRCFVVLLSFGLPFGVVGRSSRFQVHRGNLFGGVGRLGLQILIFGRGFYGNVKNCSFLGYVGSSLLLVSTGWSLPSVSPGCGLSVGARRGRLLLGSLVSTTLVGKIVSSRRRVVCMDSVPATPIGDIGINLVDPASSHMLVSKIKPCMSQYKLLHGETANGSLKQLSFIW